MAARLTELALRFPKLTLVLILLITIIAGFGLPRLRIVSYLDSALPSNDIELLKFEQFQKEFGSDFFLIFAIGCGEPTPCASVFDSKPLHLLDSIAKKSQSSKGVLRVDSISTTSILVGTNSELTTQLMPPISDREGVEAFRKLVMQDRMLVGNLISSDQRTALIIVQYSAGLEEQERNQLANKLISESKKLSEESGFFLYLGGGIPFGSITEDYARSDLGLLTPIMIVLLALYAMWVFRNLISVAIILATVGIPALWVFGVMGWMGEPITPLSSMLPILILIVGVTDAIHFLVRIFDLSNLQESSYRVIMKVAREVGPPTSITALTSSLGFLSLLTAETPGVQSFGLFAALGIMGGWLLTFSLIPVVIMARKHNFPAKTLPAFIMGTMLLNSIRIFSQKRATGIVYSLVILTILSVVGISYITADNDPIQLVGQNDFLVASNDFMQSRLRSTSSIEIVVEAANDNSPISQELISNLSAVEKSLQPYSGETEVMSILPIIRKAHYEITGEQVTLPIQPDLASQLVFLAETADPELVHRFITPDRKLFRVSAAYKGIESSKAIQDDFQDIRRLIDEAISDNQSWTITGIISLSAHLGNLVLDSQVASFSTAFLTIFLVIFIFIRSFGLGLLGMVPNVFPVMMILGFMGFYGINLDIATAMIASIVLGISVDDTMYFLVHYKKIRQEDMSVEDSVAYTFSIAGKPALFCSLILACGFFVLGFSQFQSLAIFGLLSGFAVLFAVIAELILMPAILEVFVARRERRERLQ